MSPDLFLPAEQRREVIRQYARTYNTPVFVETGTSVGATTLALVHDFDLLHTVEIDPELYIAAKRLFAPYEEKIFAWLGDSGALLPTIVKILVATKQTALFWLDGHYCGGATRGELDSPVIKELEACWEAPTGSVILVDDARIFGGGPEEGLEGYTGYPDLGWVQMEANAHGYHYQLKDDIIRLTSRES